MGICMRRGLFFGFVLIALFAFSGLSAKVLIMTHCYNRPEFISWQSQTFKKFLKDDYEFVVFNDAPNEELFALTEQVCQDLNIKMIIVPQQLHEFRGGPSVECADTIQYMMDTLGFDYPGLVVLIDSDMFLIKDFSIEQYLKKYEIAAHPQYRVGEHGIVTYLLPNLIFFNMQTLANKHTLDFDLGFIDGVNTDTAGFTHFYLESHPKLKWLRTNIFNRDSKREELVMEASLRSAYQSKLWDFESVNKFDYEFYIDFSFLHFKAGSNWNKLEENQFSEKKIFLSEAIEELLNVNIKD